MRRAVLGLVATVFIACAPGMGGGPDVPFSTVAMRATSDATPGQAAAAMEEVGADVGLIAAPGDSAWFAALASETGLTLSGPAFDGELGLAFYGPEALGDTTIELTYEGGSFTLQDALYEVRGEQFLDLMALRVDEGDAVRPLTAALMNYIATDVMNVAAVVIAVAVPTPAAAESVARLLGPGYFDVLRCDETAREAVAGEILLFYGPEARIRCSGAVAERTAAGPRIHASLVVQSP